jgi:hypothetical protein
MYLKVRNQKSEEWVWIQIVDRPESNTSKYQRAERMKAALEASPVCAEVEGPLQTRG